MIRKIVEKKSEIMEDECESARWLYTFLINNKRFIVWHYIKFISILRSSSSTFDHHLPFFFSSVVNCLTHWLISFYSAQLRNFTVYHIAAYLRVAHCFTSEILSDILHWRCIFRRRRFVTVDKESRIKWTRERCALYRFIVRYNVVKRALKKKVSSYTYMLIYSSKI